jgi:hypothetical protein
MDQSTPVPFDTDHGNALRDCLGASFNDLPEIIRSAHDGRIRLAGFVRVTRGRGLAGLFAGVMGLPASSDRCVMTVDGDHLPDRMIWIRSFDGQQFKSVFRRDGLHLVEQMGPISLRLQPVAQAGRLLYQLKAASFGTISLPHWLMPRLVAWESEHGQFYDFEVAISLPLIGRIIRYAGQLQLERR